jgi:hypothetical protein
MLRTKIAKTTKESKDVAVQTAVMGFVSIKAKIDELTKELKVHKDVLGAKAKAVLDGTEVSTITFGVDDDNVQVNLGWDIKISDEKVLRGVLGKRFEDLVSVKETFTPDKKLKEMIADDESLLECITVKEKAPAFKVVK